jgi:hypothetical protein
MKLKLEIDLSQTPFNGHENAADEAARILRTVAASIEEGETSGALTDIHSRPVGFFAVTQ